ncbi:MAG: hypothetical protein BGO43_06505 [Gammaproteobacteria bacterium 39-13]|nr:ABC transporter ATP-binding protein [Gammaproteobacteria bacterium]OJV90494.1 MAG: hypothetical protein BGO43_06505 [Gammaproteobacteria bacterium 39-13]
MSSDDIVIRVEDLGKCYQIYKQPQDRLKQFIMPTFNRLVGRQKTYYQSFWALQNISFEVRRGQSIGILGQNGSGKSTLLQIITGILAPTYGTVEVHGRIGALIELGSGFNPEFTGRENVYLNGALLGLSRQEIEQKFDQIASFADIGQHLEHAVKTYSSGMMLRLAFAVQMAIEPEILIIDEALAVGDAKFQLKCFRRLADLKENGTTILLVSHAIETVKSFCDIGLVLEGSKLIFKGDAKRAATKYFSILFSEQNQQTPEREQAKKYEDTQENKTSLFEHTFLKTKKASTVYVMHVKQRDMNCHTFGVGGAQLNYLEIHGLNQGNTLISGQEIRVICQFSWEIDKLQQLIEKGIKEKNITLGISLADKKGNYIFGCNGFDTGLEIDYQNNSNCTVEFILKIPQLIEGDYFITIAIAFGNLSNHVQLKWYDCFIQMKIVKAEKNVFGLIALDYEMNILNYNGIMNEQTTTTNI